MITRAETHDPSAPRAYKTASHCYATQLSALLYRSLDISAPATESVSHVHKHSKTLLWFTFSVITNKIYNYISICTVYLYF